MACRLMAFETIRCFLLRNFPELWVCSPRAPASLLPFEWEELSD